MLEAGTDTAQRLFQEVCGARDSFLAGVESVSESGRLWVMIRGVPRVAGVESVSEGRGDGAEEVAGCIITTGVWGVHWVIRVVMAVVSEPKAMAKVA